MVYSKVSEWGKYMQARKDGDLAVLIANVKERQTNAVTNRKKKTKIPSCSCYFCTITSTSVNFSMALVSFLCNIQLDSYKSLVALLDVVAFEISAFNPCSKS